MSSLRPSRRTRARAPIRLAVAVIAATLVLLPTLLVPIVQASSVTRAFAPRFQTTDRGGITLIGNTLLTCPASATCTNARNGIGGTINNNDFSMVYLDTDADASTFDSTSADLAVPAGANVLFAGLYWGAASANPLRDQLQLALPGGAYQTITASNTDVSATTYISFADVTSLVAGLADPSGTYLVGNVQANIGTNTAAGWSLIVVYRDLVTPAPLRNLTVFDGLLTVNATAPNSVSTTVSGFITPASGPVNPQVGLVALEGDLGFTGDQFLINGNQISNVTNPATNVFNSSISNLGTTVTTKNPNFLNQLGFDIDLIDGTGTVANSDTSATLTFNSTNETYYPAVLTFAVDVFQPKLSVPKTQADLNGGALLPGDQIQYTLDVTNNGNDTATNVVLNDPIPTGTTYVPGSMTIVTGAGAGALTDAAGDDRGEFDVGNDRVTYRLGAGGDATNGGSLAAGATTRIRFRVSVDPGATAGDVIQNQATVDYVGLTLGGIFTQDSDGDAASAGDQPTAEVVNGPPNAVNDVRTTPEDTPIAIAVLGNDTDPDGNIDPTTVTVTAGPTHGAVSINPATGVVTYTPAANYNGPDAFTYRVCDATGLCDTATVTLTVTPVEDPPNAVNDSATTAEDTPVVVNVLGNDTDPDGNLDPTSVTVTVGPTNGTVSINPVTGAVTYTPNADYNGPDAFTYQVCDTAPTPNCDTATVTLTVTAVDDPPVAVDDIATTNEDTPVVVDVVANDTDSDGTIDPTSVTIATGPTHGTVSVNPATGAVTYTPAADYNGPDSFTYRVCDDQAVCDTATVTLTVDPINDPPVANPDSASTANGDTIVIDVLANDTDVDGNLDPTSVSIVSGPSDGQVTIDPLTGAITYTPNPGASGTDAFTYQVCDTNDVCVTAVVSVTISVPNTNAFTALLTPPPGQPPIAGLLAIFIAGLAFVVVVLGVRNRDRGRPAARGARRRSPR